MATLSLERSSIFQKKKKITEIFSPRQFICKFVNAVKRTAMTKVKCPTLYCKISIWGAESHIIFFYSA